MIGNTNPDTRRVLNCHPACNRQNVQLTINKPAGNGYFIGGMMLFNQDFLRSG
ncbi:MAG: hypothetical protein PQJ61_15835 [Spirochaetales bacterium]|uniref:Uncharacterized protein n=1 Tax=Candidatus Thalassospirochaeta sargassi TaxID=3119039 RepID=A0AAJ1IHV8_9SPIO|nr:hypothetical protein [Spirochaetales bacterium]